MRICIVYLASPRDFTVPDTDGRILSRHTLLRRSLEITRRCFPTTDIYVFHEDYTEADVATLPPIKEAIRVDFSGHDDVYNPGTGRRKGYLLMCRFFCGGLQSYPQLRAYSHYMRLDDDSYFMDPLLTEAQVEPMLRYDYVFRSVFVEPASQQSLYAFTMRFLRRNGVGYLKMLQIQSELMRRELLREGTYTGVAPYNNFHMSSLRLWTQPLVVRYLHEIESVGGILRHGWLDANIHAMIVYVLSQVVPIHILHEVGFGYRHNIHVSPVGHPRIYIDTTLPMYPAEDETRKIPTRGRSQLEHIQNTSGEGQ